MTFLFLGDRGKNIHIWRKKVVKGKDGNKTDKIAFYAVRKAKEYDSKIHFLERNASLLDSH